MIEIDLSKRHPSTQEAMKWLQPNKNLPPAALAVAGEAYELAVSMVAVLPDGPQLSTGLRKLLEAKDAFVRASL